MTSGGYFWKTSTVELFWLCCCMDFSSMLLLYIATLNDIGTLEKLALILKCDPLWYHFQSAPVFGVFRIDCKVIDKLFKGQLISERNFGAFKSPKKRTKFWWIFALVSKMVKIKKINALYLSNKPNLNWYNDEHFLSHFRG